MKKQVKFIALVLTLLVSMKGIAQGASSVSNPTVVNDIVHYFYNKYYFKTNTSFTDFPVYKSPGPIVTYTGVTHVGVKFENGEPIDIYGLEFLGARNRKTANTAFPVRLYLCELDGNGFPIILPKPVDSITVMISDTIPNVLGGSFSNGAVHTMTTDFAVLFRNVSSVNVDSANILRTAGKTTTNTAAPAAEKMSDGFGFLRYSGTWHKTTNFSRPGVADPSKFPEGFGYGTDYEFCIAPRVQYTLTAGHIPPAKGTSSDNPICTQEQVVYTNISSKRFAQCQFNLIEFGRKWNQNPPFHPATLQQNGVNVFSESAAISWYFLPEDPSEPRIFLPYNSVTNQITFSTDSSQVSKVDGSDSTECFIANKFRARFKGMQKMGLGSDYGYDEDFSLCTSFCGKDRTGLVDNSAVSTIRLYPNPSPGKYTLTGLQSSTRLHVYDLLGNLFVEVVLKPDYPELNLTALPAGTYLVKFSSEFTTGVKRIVKQ